MSRRAVLPRPSAGPARAASATAAEALALARRLAPRPAPEWVPLAELAGRRLAAAVVARRDLPPADTSAMDGWAVRATDVSRPLRIVGESAAGHAPARSLGPGEGCPISTGGLVPAGADAVLRCEDGLAADGHLVATVGLRPGADVRPRGDDVEAGREMLPAGSLVGAHEVSVVAAAGHEGAFCRRRAQVVVLTTGDEMVQPGAPVPPGRVTDCNSAGIAAQARAAGIAAQARAAGAQARVAAHIRDDRCATVAALEEALDAAPDLLLTVGGVSRGVHDHVGAALDALGARWELRGVAMRPGHPVGVAVRGGTVVLALPGNPAAAAVAFHLMGRALLGATDDWVRSAPLLDPVERHRHATAFLRCAEQADGLRPLPRQGSAQLSSLAGARLLAWIDPGPGIVPAGSTVRMSRMP